MCDLPLAGRACAHYVGVFLFGWSGDVVPTHSHSFFVSEFLLCIVLFPATFLSCYMLFVILVNVSPGLAHLLLYPYIRPSGYLFVFYFLPVFLLLLALGLHTHYYIHIPLFGYLFVYYFLPVLFVVYCIIVSPSLAHWLLYWYTSHIYVGML